MSSNTPSADAQSFALDSPVHDIARQRGSSPSGPFSRTAKAMAITFLSTLRNRPRIRFFGPQLSRNRKGYISTLYSQTKVHKHATQCSIFATESS